MSEVEGRLVVNAHTIPFSRVRPRGPVQPEMSWLPVSFDRESGEGCYLMRMQPDALTIEHGTHHNSWTENGCLLAVFEWRKR